FFPLAQSADNWMWPRDLAVRMTHDDPAAMTAAIREAIHRVEAIQPVSNVTTMAELMSRELEARQTQVRVMGAFALLALALAAIGIYGVLSYSISTRTAEIGVRLALGGHPRHIRAMVVRQGAVLAGTGLVLGILVALWAVRFVVPLLFQVAPRD